MKPKLLTTGASVAMVLVACGIVAASGTLIHVGEGVSFAQIDYTYTNAQQLYSNTGIVFIDFQTITTVTSQSSGFVNVYDSAGNWLVQNVPVVGDAPLPGLSTMFDLGVSNGTPVSMLDFEVQYSVMPTAVATPTYTTTAFTVGAAENNAEGVESSRTVPPPTGPASLLGVFNSLAQTVIKFFTGHGPSVEQEINQCWPAAVANSLMYLHNTTPIVITQPHVPGTKYSPLGDSLVGEQDHWLNREPKATPKSYQKMIEAKLEFKSNNELGDKIKTKHQGYLGGSNYKYAGLTSYGKGTTVTADWILKELNKGEDVEFVFAWATGGAHAVQLIGGGTILGVPWIAFVHDAEQGYENGSDTRGTGLFDGGYGFAFLIEKDGRLYVHGYTTDGEGVDAKAVFAMSQSYVPEPATLMLLAAGSMALRRRRR